MNTNVCNKHTFGKNKVAHKSIQNKGLPADQSWRMVLKAM
jgi:hypothetical protein